MPDMKTTWCLLFLVWLGCLSLPATDSSTVTAPTPKPGELARFNGVWRGKWDNIYVVELTIKHSTGNQFAVVSRHKEKTADTTMVESKGAATYDPQTKRLKYTNVELSWHDDEKRLVAKGNFPKFTRYAILTRQDPAKLGASADAK